MTQKEVGRLVHKDYEVHAGKSGLMRSGFLLVGYCDDEHRQFAGKPGAEMSLMRDPHRADSGSEHSDGCIHLAYAVAMWRPKLIHDSELRRLTQLFLYHDAPEVRRGDWPDDGSRNDAVKDAEESAVLKEQIAHWPRKRYEELLSDYEKFQRHEGRLFQVAYCIDKIEAILRALEYERLGIVGDLRHKLDQMSEQDRRFAEEIGTYLAADGWARHALERLRNCTGRGLAYWIMAAAFEDVRGEVPAWYLRFKPEKGTQ